MQKMLKPFFSIMCMLFNIILYSEFYSYAYVCTYKDYKL